MRRKYIEDTFGQYFIFGKHSDERVDLASPENSSLATVTKEDAENLIKERTELLDSYERLLNAFSHSAPGECRAFWREEQIRLSKGR